MYLIKKNLKKAWLTIRTAPISKFLPTPILPMQLMADTSAYDSDYLGILY